jgi:hypothetical protein
MGQPVQRVSHQPLYLVAELRLAAGHAHGDEQQRRTEGHAAPKITRRHLQGNLHKIDDSLRVGINEARTSDLARCGACTVVADRERRQDEGHGKNQRRTA